VLVGLGIAGAFTPVASAVGQDSQLDAPQDLLEDATRKVMQALELMIGAIPQYQLPEILDNGDIIIRRVQPVPKPRPEIPPDDGEINETST